MLTLEEICEAMTHLTVSQRLKVGLRLRELDGISIAENQVREALPVYAATTAIASSPSFMTFEEYLEFEKASPLQHELINGVVFAMSPSSLIHQRIVLNLMVAIRAHLKRGPCEVFFSGLLLAIRRNENEIAYHPDVMVDCRADTRDTHYLRDPKLVVEVLSPSTQDIDRREKMQNYRQLDSVEEYVIVAQDMRHVTVYPRAERWKPRVYGGLDAAVEFRSIDLSVPLSELYADIPIS